MSDFINRVNFGFKSVDEAFPPVDTTIIPLGSRVMVQLRSAKKKTAGGIILVEDTVDTERYNTQISKVVAIGPLAFRNRDTMQLWPEGRWCVPGDFVRTPKFGGDRWSVPVLDAEGNPTEDEAHMVIFNDLDIIGKVVGDPLAVRAYL